MLAENLAGLPPTYLVTAEFDPVRDEGRAYAARLIEAGNDVIYREMRGATHGLWMMNGISPGTAEMTGGVADWIAGRWR